MIFFDDQVIYRSDEGPDPSPENKPIELIKWALMMKLKKKK